MTLEQDLDGIRMAVDSATVELAPIAPLDESMVRWLVYTYDYALNVEIPLSQILRNRKLIELVYEVRDVVVTGKVSPKNLSLPNDIRHHATSERARFSMFAKGNTVAQIFEGLLIALGQDSLVQQIKAGHAQKIDDK